MPSPASLVARTRADLYGGYSYVNIDTNGLTSRQSANGWEATISGNFNEWFAVDGDVSGYYKTYSADLGGATTGEATADYSFAVGPRINFKPIFIHALFGADHLKGTLSEVGSPSTSASQDGMAGLVGGGVQFKVSGPWSIRASADYVFTRHNIFGGPSVTQNNYRAGAGIVYSFGTKHESEPPARVTQPGAIRAIPPVNAARSGVNVPSLGVIVILGNSAGAEIALVTPDGVAAHLGLHSGDVIDAVDGRPVKTPIELASELAKRQVGEKIRLGYMLHGEWQIEAIVLLGGAH